MYLLARTNFYDLLLYLVCEECVEKPRQGLINLFLIIAYNELYLFPRTAHR